MINKKLLINKLEFKNRVMVGPMCQYSANKNGTPSKWHYTHLDNLCKTGAAVVMFESTAVNSSGRITKKDLVLQNEKQFISLKKLVTFLKKNKVKLGLQISHSGKKGSVNLPWIKNGKPLKKNERSWKTFSASAIKRDKSWPKPEKLSFKQINKIIKDFKKTTSFANKIGFDCLEVHMAHGYLLHQFYSPISNIRKDKYGGNLKNRCRFLLEVFKEVKKIWPKNKVLGARITGSDHLKRGCNIQDAIYLAKELKKLGADYVSVSSGGIKPKTNLKFYQGYNLKFAKTIKKIVDIKVITLGMLNTRSLINKILKNKHADMVAVSRRFINEPSWLKNKSSKIIKYEKIPKQYIRCFN